MKRWIAFLLFWAMLFTMTACGGASAADKLTLPELESDYSVEIPIYEVTALKVYNSKGELCHDLTYTDFIYDENGELESRTQSNEYTEDTTTTPTYEYDENGRVVKAISEKVFSPALGRYLGYVTEYEYDEQGRTIRTVKTDTDAPSYYVIYEYTYYDNGFMETTTKQTSEFPGEVFTTKVDYVYNENGTIQSKKTSGTDYFYSTYDYSHLAEFSYNDLGYISDYQMTSSYSDRSDVSTTSYQCAYDSLGYLTNVQMDPHYDDGLTFTRNYIYSQTSAYYETTDTDNLLKKTDEWEYFKDCKVLPLPSSVMTGVSAQDDNKFSLDDSDEIIYDTWGVYGIVESMFFSGSIRRTNPVFDYLAAYFCVLEQILGYDVTVYENGGTLISKDDIKLAVVTTGFDGNYGYCFQVNLDCEDIELSGETEYSFAAKERNIQHEQNLTQTHPEETSATVEAFLSDTYVAIDGGLDHTVVLYADGTVKAIGGNNNGQCDVEDWTGIVQISTTRNHTVGLKADGRVVAVGDNGNGQCDVSAWTDIVQVSAGKAHTVGLKSDGTVVAVGASPYGECDVYGWTDIVAVGAAYNNTFGLCSDGTVIVSGAMRKGQIPGWDDITSISVSDAHIVGMRADGTLRSVGTNNHGQCDVSEWSNIVAVSTGCAYTVGLRADGTVLVQGIDDVGQHEATSWNDIIYIATGLEHTIGVKRDGTIIAVGANDNGQCNVDMLSE